MSGTKNFASLNAKLQKVGKVQNKQPASMQITAEQLIREANERQFEMEAKAPRQQIVGQEELDMYKSRKRKEFEEIVRGGLRPMSWLKYAQFEEGLKEFERARSIFERALQVDPRNQTFYLKYAEMEMRCKFVNHARNVWDRAVTLLPRVSHFWYKYAYMEEMLGNIAGARLIFERWMHWEPEEQAWLSFIKFEQRYGEKQRVRDVYERFVVSHPETKNWIKYAKFEEQTGNVVRARGVYERAMSFFGEEFLDEKLYIAFASFEESSKEYERAKVIYKYALERLPKNRAEELLQNYTRFEKRFGERQGIEDIILSKRRFHYEEEIKINPSNYDVWFDYIRLEESNGEIDRVRDVYERAIANLPPAEEKRLWRRYVYLWIYYALYEELQAKDLERAREVYKAVMNIVPHRKFTFAKLWLLYAKFEVRQKNLSAARKLLGTALGMCPKDQIFRGYIDLELQLREFDRCRKLYEKFIEFNESNSTTWIKYAELETVLGDYDRARAIFELAISSTNLDMPEVVWKAFMDFENELEESDRTRALYKRLLQRTQHVKVWISYAQFELSLTSRSNIDQARAVFAEGDKILAKNQSKEERVILLEAWKDFETAHGDAASRAEVQKKMPNKVKKRRPIVAGDGSEAGWEEYYDYIFPDEEENAPKVKLLQAARQWMLKKQQEQQQKQQEQKEEEDEDSGITNPKTDGFEVTEPHSTEQNSSTAAPDPENDDQEEREALAAFRKAQQSL